MSARLQQLQNFLKEEPNDPFLLYAMATEYLKMEDLPQALAFYLKTIEADENYVGTYYHLGKLYEKLTNPTAAEQAYKKGMSISRSLQQNHAFSELQQAYNKLMGLDYEDE